MRSTPLIPRMIFSENAGIMRWAKGRERARRRRREGGPLPLKPLVTRVTGGGLPSPRVSYKHIFMSSERVPLSAPVLQRDSLLAALRAAGEETRLRILSLLAEGELNVSDLTDILGQSQPRISRHLKLLAEAGLIERHREGAWAFFHLADRGAIGAAVKALVVNLDPKDARLSADKARLTAVRETRAKTAQAFCAGLASQWDRLRALHVPEEAVETAIREAVGE